MKIALPNENASICSHFGKAPQFSFYEVEDGSIRSNSIVNTAAEGHDARADFLSANAVDLLICGGIGQHATDALKAKGIEVVNGAKGDIDEAVRAYLAGTLETNPDTAGSCTHKHGHGHEHH
ncbi:NifB/NifX family molybdenum-iron cluster-binding protein [Selenomonas sp. TAMA-11512]|uniref:NifB/NifX family molybdenum-iron cluster-binding protein n=1 Tax=Selenomonas sp. TAMA-11512 TaxID=3095337 RepID=UPI0030925AB6|nr:NifB/NifX family molybdenum-iron cluster-binding protein [Selenomonas sp. TAMA-11512]